MAGLAALFDFERVEARRNAFLLVLVAAFLSPNVSMPGGIPAIRAEQVVMLVLMPSLGLYLWQRRAPMRLGLIDFAFAALAFATMVTITVAPLFVEDVAHQVRDVFELARVAEYWLIFRLGMTVIPDRALSRGVLAVLAVLTIGMTALSVVQYLSGDGWFNRTVTDAWTVSHNLDGVTRAGRVVGTVGNANYYGALSGLLIVASLAPILLRYPMTRGWYVAALAAAAAGTLSLVMSQSRTATLATLGAMFLGLVFVALRRKRQAAYAVVAGCFVASFVASVAFVEAAPPEVGSWSSRFAPSDIREDSSLTIRISKWKSIFSGLFDTPPTFCEGERLESLRTATGHETSGVTGLPAADASGLARDEQRLKDVSALTRGVLDYFCAEDEWPADMDLASALVPRFMDALPTDPGKSDAYPVYIHRSGFVVGARLEDGSDARGPIYSLGTIPNFALNPSFETGDGGFDRWSTLEGAAAAPSDLALYGKRSAELTLPAGSSFYQTLPIDLSRETDYTVSGWLRSVEGSPEAVELYLTATMTSGATLDPFLRETIAVPGGDAWQPFSLSLQTPENERVTVLQIFLRPAGSDQEPARVLVDGLSITQSTFAPSFVTLRDIDPSSLEDDLPGFSDSPLIGAGPQRDLERGSVDNEYLLFLDRYGLLGTAAYLALFAGALLAAWRAWRDDTSFVAVTSLSMMVFTVALMVFNIAAGSYYHFQIMAVFWLLTGFLAGNARVSAGATAQAQERATAGVGARR